MFLITKFNSLLSFIHLNIPSLIGVRQTIMAPRVVSSNVQYVLAVFQELQLSYSSRSIFQKPRNRVSEEK